MKDSHNLHQCCQECSQYFLQCKLIELLFHCKTPLHKHQDLAHSDKRDYSLESKAFSPC